ncbi:hypothetical protein SBA3_1310005 [Candidatus Sulfopaludibacter sp. SbA3]|nr:hypothetical protein SBA3_1310005 [Candidatus Sulfopaludibacter sp. SbA3]
MLRRVRRRSTITTCADLRQHGIYQVKDGTLHTALAAVTAPRPNDFTAAPGDGRTVSQWSRHKKAIPAKSAQPAK